MANETTATSVNDSINSSLVQAEVIDCAWSALVCQPLVMEKDITGQKTNTAKFPKWDAIAAAGLVDGTDLTNTEQTTSGVDITAAEVGVMVTPTDYAMGASVLANLNDFAGQLGKAVADKIDSDIAALFAGFSNSVGSTGVDISEANILAAIYTLENADASDPFVCVLHPIQISDLRNIWATSTGVINFGTTPNAIGVAQNGYFGTRYRVDFFETTNVALANTAADRCGAMFSLKKALGMVVKKAVNIEFQRDASLRATEVVCVSTYGVGELVDTFGVKIVTDA